MDINKIGLHKLAQWSYDTDYWQFVKDMGFKDFTEDYCSGKFMEMQDNFTRWLGSLSEKYLENLAEAINNKEMI